MEYRYVLEPYNGMKSRYVCPNCNHKSRSFSRYIDSETGEYINPIVGRCNREENCSYHYPPKQYFKDQGICTKSLNPIPKRKTPFLLGQQKQTSFIPTDVFKTSLKNYGNNNFVRFLIENFGEEVANTVLQRYFIGTSNHWPGATIFWQIDIDYKIRAGKIMLYNSSKGKRVKEPFSYITWVHSLIKQPGFALEQCLFGEHLLANKSKVVMVVESEKTAVISSIFMPEYIWLATGGINNINEKICGVLKGRDVIFHPDFGASKKWEFKVSKLQQNCNFLTSNLLDENMKKYGLKNGADIADYLII